jgi:hypothetical protein
MATLIYTGGDTVVLGYLDVTDITAQPANDWIATSSIDGGGNSGILFATDVALFIAPDSSGLRVFDYLDLANTMVLPVGIWYAGANSIDSGDNFNWIFSGGPEFDFASDGPGLDGYPIIGVVNQRVESCIKMGGF